MHAYISSPTAPRLLLVCYTVLYFELCANCLLDPQPDTATLYNCMPKPSVHRSTMNTQSNCITGQTKSIQKKGHTVGCHGWLYKVQLQPRQQAWLHTARRPSCLI